MRSSAVAAPFVLVATAIRLTLKLAAAVVLIIGTTCCLYAVSITLSNPGLVGEVLLESIQMRRWPLRIVDGN